MRTWFDPERSFSARHFTTALGVEVHLTDDYGRPTGEKQQDPVRGRMNRARERGEAVLAGVVEELGGPAVADVVRGQLGFQIPARHSAIVWPAGFISTTV